MQNNSQILQILQKNKSIISSDILKMSVNNKNISNIDHTSDIDNTLKANIYCNKSLIDKIGFDEFINKAQIKFVDSLCDLDAISAAAILEHVPLIAKLNPSKAGFSSIHWASVSNEFNEILIELLNNANIEQNEFLSAIDWSIKFDNPQAFNLLLAKSNIHLNNIFPSCTKHLSNQILLFIFQNQIHFKFNWLAPSKTLDNNLNCFEILNSLNTENQNQEQKVFTSLELIELSYLNTNNSSTKKSNSI